MQGCTRFSDSTGKRASVSLGGVRGSLTQGVGFEFCLEGWEKHVQRFGVQNGRHIWRMVASSGAATLGWDDVLGKQLGVLEKLAEPWL